MQQIQKEIVFHEIANLAILSARRMMDTYITFIYITLIDIGH